MGEKVDREKVQAIEAKLERVLEQYPELLEANPEREQALETWLEDMDKGGTDDGV